MIQSRTVRGIISGYFNPIHGGHIDLIREAARNCDYLIAIVNSDFQRELKGSSPFMDEDHRGYILENIKGVEEVIVAIDRDKSVAATLCFLREKYPNDDLKFFNGGDRQKGNLNSAETETCMKLGIKEVVLDQEKRYSSSELIHKAAQKI